MKKNLVFTLLICLLICASCAQPTEPTPEGLTLEERPVQILINEVYTGDDGANQEDFIELFNAGTEIANLTGNAIEGWGSGKRYYVAGNSFANIGDSAVDISNAGSGSVISSP
mgnify:CR=1 FL=1